MRRTVGRDELGNATLQHLVVSPVLFALLLTILQAGLSFYGSLVCRFAADAAVEQAASVDGTEDSAKAEARRRLDALGTRIFEAPPTVVVTRTAESAEVEIRARVYHVAPRLFDTSMARVSLPVQRFRPPGGDG